MTAQNFTTRSKHCPNPCTTIHTDGNPTPYTCHMAAMHWAFMDLGDLDAVAHSRVLAIMLVKCTGCSAGGFMHGSIPATWYGPRFCGLAGNTLIADRASLHATVNVGDVLAVGKLENPSHSMVVVGKNSLVGHKFVYVRGFNNLGTLGTGQQLQYDNSDRDIDKDRYWHTQGTETRFGTAFNTGGWLYRIPYAGFIARAAVVRNNCNNLGGPWTYVGP
jgi:hypothetical protein